MPQRRFQAFVSRPTSDSIDTKGVPLVNRRVRVAALAGGAFALLGIFAGQSLLAAPPPSQLPPAKQAIEDFAAKHRAAGQAADKKTDPGRPRAEPDPPAVTGMLGAVGAPEAGEAFTPTSSWAGWTDATTYVQVWGGGNGLDPSQGAVLIAFWHGANGFIDPSSEPVLQSVAPPIPGGPLRILRIEGNDLVVTNPAGREMYFNPAARAFH